MAPGSVGLAFVDAKGQWGTARRQDFLPDWGRDGILQRSTRTATVKHGAANVSLPMQILLQPAVPACAHAGGEWFTAETIFLWAQPPPSALRQKIGIGPTEHPES